VWREVKLDPEEQIIATALARTALDEVNERGAEARIEFLREGYAKVTITISHGLLIKAIRLDWSIGELFAEAVRISVPGALGIEALAKARCRAA
jgi:hypothetical protein